MANNEWRNIAEVYRNREHKVLSEILTVLNYDMDDSKKVKLINGFVVNHLKTTGRQGDSVPEIKQLSIPDAEARAALLAMLAPSQEELGAYMPPAPKLTKSGKIRKQRSDKGKKRKVKV